MNSRVVGVALIATLLAAATVAAPAAAPPTPPWVTTSNHYAEALMAVQAKYQPESASALGVERFDAEVLDLKPQVAQRSSADLAAVAVQFALLTWFGAELILAAGQVGLAERAVGAVQAGWPLLVVLSCLQGGRHRYRAEAEPAPAQSTTAA